MQAPNRWERVSFTASNSFSFEVKTLAIGVTGSGVFIFPITLTFPILCSRTCVDNGFFKFLSYLEGF